MNKEKLATDLAAAQAAFDAMPDEQRGEFEKGWGRPEPLDDELADHLYDDEPFGLGIKHPLVFSIAHSAMQNAHVNKMLAYKKKALAKALEKRDWNTYVYLHERPYRMDAFIELVGMDVMTSREYWTVLGSIWTDTENMWQSEEDWQYFLENGPAGHLAMMDEDERALFYQLPDEFTVYRGFQIDGRWESMSWTTDKSIAEFFAKRLLHPDETPYIAEGKVKKEHVIALFQGRGESEIVVLPDNVFDISIDELEGNDED